MDEALTRLGMPVPDSALARRARQLITDVAAPFLVNHSVRVYAWAVELARHDRLRFDPEILYVSSMLPVACRMSPGRLQAGVRRAEGMLEEIAQAPFDS